MVICEARTQTSTAIFSDDRLYRYELTRVWDDAQPSMGFVMLNPSTADAHEDDPTIRRCKQYAKDQGFGGIVVVNLYAYRSPEPSDLWTVEDPVGPENDAFVEGLKSRCSKIVVAWGKNATEERVREVLPLLGDDLYCLCKNADGSPHHPLYIHEITGEAWPA
ncbi:hypothetical protein KIM372_11710 [Bombiscardovia nodaiensis]|uniref:DUF1643 domain-containing protein n=1 Tax=Bombiscardovia nodaiensis TaxID=2932181 RepID=A0ABN6SB17_9BIFI|nr:hypothetical protein KIM372_11710 [Bombiscardovia nodaiensis]